MKASFRGLLMGVFAAFASNTTTAAEATTDQIIIHLSATVAFPTPAAEDLIATVRGVVNRSGMDATFARVTGFNSQVWHLDRPLSPSQITSIGNLLKKADPRVRLVEPDTIMRPSLTPNDPFFFQQQNIAGTAAFVNVQSTWDTFTGTGVRVAVIDTGYTNHSDLLPNIQGGYDFISSSSRARDGSGRDPDSHDAGDWATPGDCGDPVGANSTWHGTEVSGVVAAKGNNSVGIAGVAFNAKIVPIRGLGKCGGYTSDLTDAVLWASGGSVPGVPSNPYPARILNLSFGEINGVCSGAWLAAVQAARQRGAIIIAAAGNRAEDMVNTSPANCPGVISVAAVNDDGSRWYLSNYGTQVYLAAPGAGIYLLSNSGTTTAGTENYIIDSGTSYAAPQVAAVAALMLEYKPTLRTDDFNWKLLQSARGFPVACPGCGVGLLDAGNAISVLNGYYPSVVPLFSVSLVTDNGVNATWQLSNPRNAPVILGGLAIEGSSVAAIQSTTCGVGNLVPPAGTCTVVTSDGLMCGGGVYYTLAAVNSAGTGRSSVYAFSPDGSCGGS